MTRIRFYPAPGVNVSDADAAVGEVKSPKTFYSVAAPKKTGTMATRTLNPDNETVLVGYYAATTLSAVDVHLAAANIKSGITIFGFTGPATVQDIADADAAVGDVKDTVTFYSVTGARKTGIMATVALNAAANAYPAGYHAGAASLTAVDGDLVAGNIADGITIFGVLGTLAPGALALDLEAFAVADPGSEAGSGTMGYDNVTGDLVTDTSDYAANSLAIAAGFFHGRVQSGPSTLYLYMDGVEMDSVSVVNYKTYIVQGNKALVGSKICKTTMGGTSRAVRGSGTIEGRSFGIAIGSVKLV